MQFNQNVKVPFDFFAKSKREYSDWRFAFFREAIQNAYDAGASQIQFFIESLDNDLIQVRCIDDGKGMSKDILLNVLLCLGGSHKEGDEQIGGFGYAKVVLFFAHESYEIKTHHHHIQGRGGEYAYAELDTPVQGVEFTVNMSRDEAVSADYLEERLKTLVSKSGLRRSVTISCNGQVITPDKTRSAYTLGTELGTLRISDADSYNSILWIRVNGLPMFNHRVYGEATNFKGVLDLDGSPLDRLTANRDGLLAAESRKLTGIIHNLIEVRTALKCEDLVDVVLNETQAAQETDDVPQGRQTSAVKLDIFAKLVESTGLGANPATVAKAGQGRSIEAVLEGLKKHPFMRLKQKADTVTHRVKERFSRIDKGLYPANFRIKTSGIDGHDKRYRYTEIARNLGQVRYGKLAHAWRVVVHAILQSPYAKAHGVYPDDHHRGEFCLNGKRITLGFVFSHELGGVCAHSDEEISILINPYHLPDDYVIGDMVDVATHECAHLWMNGHGDDFCALEVDLKRSLRRSVSESDLMKRVRAAIKTSVLARRRQGHQL